MLMFILVILEYTVIIAALWIVVGLGGIFLKKQLDKILDIFHNKYGDEFTVSIKVHKG